LAGDTQDAPSSERAQIRRSFACSVTFAQSNPTNTEPRRVSKRRVSAASDGTSQQAALRTTAVKPYEPLRDPR
jgi:hypothetical protein